MLLADQDRSRWNRDAIERATVLVDRAARMRRPGRFQVQAAIAATHARASAWPATDWKEITRLYDLLFELDPSPVVAMNRAIAIGELRGLHDGLAALGEVNGMLDRYHLFHATHAELLRRAGRTAQAREATARALTLVSNEGERRLLQERLAALG